MHIHTTIYARQLRQKSPVCHRLAGGWWPRVDCNSTELYCKHCLLETADCRV